MSDDDNMLPDDLVILRAPHTSDLALVLGQAPLPADLGTLTATMPSGALKSVLQVAGLTAHAGLANGFTNGRWVQLTAESAAAIEKYGNNGTGLVRQAANGRIAHVVKFESLSGSAMAATSMVGGLAMQLALARIEAQLERLTQAVDSLISGSQNETEGQLASCLHVLQRVERGVESRGHVSDDDWDSLAELEGNIKRTYHEVARRLDPLRELTAQERPSLAQQLKLMKGTRQLKDLDFWLRMQIHAEFALARWEALHLLRTATQEPSRLEAEAQLVREEALSRYQPMLDLSAQIDSMLGSDDNLEWFERLRLISRYQLRQLRQQLGYIANAYANALGRPFIDVEVEGTTSQSGIPTLGGRVQRVVQPALSAGGHTMDAVEHLGGRLQRLLGAREAGSADDRDSES